MWDFLLWVFYHVPWLVQAAVLLAIYGAAVVVVGTLFGWGIARKLAWPAIAIVGALIFLARSRQQGYADRKDEEKIAEDKGKKVVEEIRTDVDRKSDKEVEDETDRWTRP